MCRAFFALLAVLAVAASASGSARAKPAALSCGLPEAQPAWIDFTDSAVSFWRDRFARPGVVIATGGEGIAGEARAAGAGVVHWDMYLKRRVGTPIAPADPSVIAERADAMYQKAVAVTACDRPLIALNELWGGWQPTPLTPTADQYRANVLAYVRRLAERGARPALLISSRPYTGGDAAVWWRAIGAVSDIVLEKYPDANVIWRAGAIDGSRQLRVSYRKVADQFRVLGIPSSRIGIMVGFQTGPGTGGREGLKPRSRWFSVAKWQALAARQVSRELRLGHVWSWGWAQRNERSNDPDKTFAACVWLWSRDAKLCDAPGILGGELDTDVRTGQLVLPPGVRCTYGASAIRASGVASLAALTRDRELALTALVERAVTRESARASSSDALAVERRIVVARFGGNGDAYRAALRDAGASASVARSALGDELRSTEIAEQLDVPAPTSGDVARFRATYAAVLARRVEVSPEPTWLPGGTGIALATSAPAAVFQLATGRKATLMTAEGRFVVEPLDETTALGAVPSEQARPAVVRELRAAKRADAYAAWSIRKQKAAQARLVCERDQLPELGAVRLSTFAPFLSLDESEAAAWASARKR
jgi:hypothetical protein